MHNTKELRCRRGLENFGEIIARLSAMAGRCATILDCADIGFLPDGILDQLPPLLCHLSRRGTLRRGRAAGMAGAQSRTRA